MNSKIFLLTLLLVVLLSLQKSEGQYRHWDSGASSLTRGWDTHLDTKGWPSGEGIYKEWGTEDSWNPSWISHSSHGHKGYGGSWNPKVWAGSEDYGGSWSSESQAGNGGYGGSWSSESQAGHKGHGSSWSPNWSSENQAGHQGYGSGWNSESRAAHKGYGDSWSWAGHGGYGSCRLKLISAGGVKCKISIQNKVCDVHCNRRYKGKFSCVKGNVWSPPLPKCVRPDKRLARPIQGSCRLKLISAGGVKCKNDIYGTTTCHVHCSKKYQGEFSCSKGNVWSPRLPHCVRPDTRSDGRILPYDKDEDYDYDDDYE